jgi:hypothetical protein
VDLEKAHAH